MLKKIFCFLLLFAVVIFVACNRKLEKKERPTFKPVEGIKFIEVRREFDTGYSFSKDGFQQVPEWTLYFLPGDSVKIWSPFEKRYIHYPIYFDHDKVINFAREWLRVIHTSKDSLVLQLLKVESKEVKKDLSKVYMRFYSEAYINKVLKADYHEMRKPQRKDTLFIKGLINRANSYPTVSDSLFSSREPVKFVSLSDNIKVEKRSQSKDALDYSAANEYLNPAYDITIRKAYKDFSYQYTAFVGTDGQITVGSFANFEEEFKASKARVLQGITDLYLERYLKVTPGSTLGMKHPTEVVLFVQGNKE